MSYDDFCLDDQVLCQMMDLCQRSQPSVLAPMPGAAPTNNMFDSFLPPGPICGDGDAPAAPVSVAPPHGTAPPATVDRSQLLEGEVHLLRAKLQHAQQQNENLQRQQRQWQSEQHDLLQWQQKRHDDRIRDLQSDLSFQEHEVRQAQQARAQMRAQLDELQSSVVLGEPPRVWAVEPPSSRGGAVGRVGAAPPSVSAAPPAEAAAGVSAAVVATGGALGAAPLGVIGSSNSPLFYGGRPSPSLRKRARAPCGSPARALPPPGRLCDRRGALPRAHTSRSSAAPSSRSSQQLPPLLQPASTPSSRRTMPRVLPPPPPPPTTAAGEMPPPPQPACAAPAPADGVEHATFTIEIVPDADADTAAPAVNSVNAGNAATAGDGAGTGADTNLPAVAETRLACAAGITARRSVAPAAEDAEAAAACAVAAAEGGRLLLAQLLAQPEASFDEFVLLGARGGVRALPAAAANRAGGSSELQRDVLRALQQLLVSGSTTAPELLRALLPHLKLGTALPPPAAATRRLRCVLTLMCVLLAESASCRRSFLTLWPDPSLEHDVPPTPPVFPASPSLLPPLISLIDALSSCCTCAAAHELLVPAVSALANALWDTPTSWPPALLLPWLEAGSGGSTPPVLGMLLDSSMPLQVRLCALSLLQHLAVTASGYARLLPEVAPGATKCAHPAAQAAAMLTAPPPQTRPALVGAGDLGESTPSAARGVAALAKSSLQFFSAVVAAHDGAAARLLSSSFDLALPVRLVAILQDVVHALLPDEGSAAAELLELDLVREALELLLQLWQCTSMRDALVVGSWSDDLRSVCGHLVRGDVHPQLAELALPAKILQNALG